VKFFAIIPSIQRHEYKQYLPEWIKKRKIKCIRDRTTPKYDAWSQILRLFILPFITIYQRYESIWEKRRKFRKLGRKLTPKFDSWEEVLVPPEVPPLADLARTLYEKYIPDWLKKRKLSRVRSTFEHVQSSSQITPVPVVRKPAGQGPGWLPQLIAEYFRRKTDREQYEELKEGKVGVVEALLELRLVKHSKLEIPLDLQLVRRQDIHPRLELEFVRPSTQEIHPIISLTRFHKELINLGIGLVRQNMVHSRLGLDIHVKRIARARLAVAITRINETGIRMNVPKTYPKKLSPEEYEMLIDLIDDPEDEDEEPTA
jgi:hypothetical protein